MLCLKKFSRRIGSRCIIQNISLELQAGETACLLGANGAGKSVLLSTLAAVHALHEGELFFSGRDLRLTAARQDFLGNCAYLSHSPGIFYNLTVEENIEFFGKIFTPYRKHKTKARRKKQEELLEIVGLGDRYKQTVSSLSRGLKQRLGLLRCFLQKPKIFLLDEPFTFLDHQGIHIFARLLKQSIQEGSMAVIAGHTEDIFQKNQIASRFLFLKQGRLIADIPVQNYGPKAQAKVREMLWEK